MVPATRQGNPEVTRANYVYICEENARKIFRRVGLDPMFAE
jgi:hypothetical protein